MISKAHIQFTLTFLLIDLYHLTENPAEKTKFCDRIIELIYENFFTYVENDMEDLYDKPKDTVKDFVINIYQNNQDIKSSAIAKKLESIMNKMIQEGGFMPKGGC